MSDPLTLPDPHSALDVLYQCPGEPHSISRDIHLARIAASWPACRSCPSRHDVPQNLAVRTHSDVRTDILLTRWGFRGVWQNAIPRDVAAQLTSISVSHLHSMRSADRIEGSVETASTTRADSCLRLALGYDGRDSSPDIYCGAVSAALQNGADVVDAGRTTMAGLQELVRSDGDVQAGILVTGSGLSAPFTGMDLFLRDGSPLTVPWQDWNLTVRRCSRSMEEPNGSPADQQLSGEPLDRLMQSMAFDELSPYPQSGHAPLTTNPGTEQYVLELPHGSVSAFRRSRSSGTSVELDAESQYRGYVRRWFPQRASQRISCVCLDPLIVERLEWLSSQTGLTADILLGRNNQTLSAQVTERVRDTHAEWGIGIDEDDRIIQVVNRHGSALAASELTDWLNAALSQSMPHVTAHVSHDEDRIQLLDAGRPGQGSSCETISDALAITGCVCRLLEDSAVLPHR